MSRSLIADPPPPPPDDRPKRRSEPPSGGGGSHRNWWHLVPYVLGGLLIVVGIVFGLIAYRMLILHENFTRSASRVIPIIVESPQSVFGKERIYVMLLGIDFNYDEKGMPYSKGARSDTIMVAGLDFPTKSMKLVSILRESIRTVAGPRRTPWR